MSNIYELTGEWLSLYAMADDDSIDEQTWFDTMEALEGEIEIKAENTAKVIKQLTADADGIKAEADRLAKRAKALDNRAEWLKKNLQASMEATGKTKFKTDLFSFGIQKNPASLKVDEGFNVNDAPAEYIKFAEPQLDKQALTKAIKEGAEFSFCHLEQSESLRIR